MKSSLPLIAFLILAGCSDPPIEQQDEATVAEIEKQIETDAQSLEEAADEAVKVLEDEINAELADDGISASQAAEAPTSSAEEGEQQ